MAFTDVIARLAISLNLDTAAFQTGTRKAQKDATNFQGHMTRVAKAVGGALAGMVSWEVVSQLRDMTQAAVDAAGGLGEEAAALGVSTRALQEYRYAATQVGLSQGEMDQGLAQLTRRLGDAALGAKEPAKALEQLGISLDQVRGKDAGDVIPLIAEGMSKIPDPAQRAAIAVDLFGKSGQKLMALLEGGAAGVDTLRQAAQDLGVVLSESDIAKADEVADKVAALRYVLEAQQNKKLLENAEALLKYEQGVSDLKMGLIGFVNDSQSFLDAGDAWATNLRNMMRDIYGGTLADAVERMKWRVLGSIQAMINGIGQYMGNALGRIWAKVKGDLGQVGDFFHRLYMRVVGNSDIPDMVDEIGQHMARLDSTLVDPAERATKKAGDAFRELRGLLDRLFPEKRAALDFAADAEVLKKSLQGGELEAAMKRLSRERFGLNPAGGTILAGTDVSAAPLGSEEMDKAQKRYEEWLGRFEEKSKTARVEIAKSFGDLAQDTVASLGRMTDAIKRGGFLNILESVLSFGLQLGSIGVFGSKIAGNINRTVPAYANGTDFHPGGLALVGEKRPELIELPRGSRVHPDVSALAGRGGRLEILPSKLFDVYLDGKLVQAAGPIVARAKGETLRALSRPSLG
ncbi:hypothetical protein [Tsuneonella sp. HG222]